MKIPLDRFDSMPRTILIPGVGAVCAGKDVVDAGVVRDIVARTVAAKVKIAATARPPICIAAYAGAAIAGTSPMRKGYACMRLGIIAYVVPFVFVFDPLLLLQGEPLLVTLALATAVGGTIAIGIAMVGYFVRPVGWAKRLLLLSGGAGLLIPPGGAIAYSWAINGIGAIICLALVLYEWHARKTALGLQQAAGRTF